MTVTFPADDESRETHANLCASNRKTWEIFSEDPVTQRWFEDAGATFIRETSGGGRFYTLPVAQWKPHKRRQAPVLTDEQKRAATERLRAMNAQRKLEREAAD